MLRMNQFSKTLLLVPPLLALSTANISCRKENLVKPASSHIDVDSGAPNASDFSSETTLSSNYTSVIKPNYDAGTAGSFSGVDGINISYRVVKAIGSVKGSVMILPGRTEPHQKYAEVIWDLNRQGYTVFIMSHRGQGESGRMLSDPQIGYVKKFRDYVTDAQTFIGIFKSQAQGKKFLLAHSMGGAIGAYLAKENAGDFDAFVLSSPMIEINTAPYPSDIAWDIVTYTYGIGDGEKYAIGKGPFNENEDFNNFAQNDVTHSKPRWQNKMDMFIQNKSLQLGGPSNQWVSTSVKATLEIRRFAGEVQAPILMLQASADDIVITSSQTSFCSSASKCQLSTFPGAYHEILMEAESISGSPTRGEAMAKIVRYFNHF